MSKEDYYYQRIKELAALPFNFDGEGSGGNYQKEAMEALVRVLYDIYDKIKEFDWDNGLFELYPGAGRDIYFEQHYHINQNEITVLGTHYFLTGKIEITMLVNDDYRKYVMEDGVINKDFIIRLKEVLLITQKTRLKEAIKTFIAKLKYFFKKGGERS